MKRKPKHKTRSSQSTVSPTREDEPISLPPSTEDILVRPNTWRGVGSIYTHAQKATRIHRRNLVASLYLTGTHTTRSISRYIELHYGVRIDHSTIVRDLQELRTQWQENSMRSTNALVMREVAKLDEQEKVLIHALQESDINVADYVTAQQRIAKRRAALLGLDKAIKIDVNDKRTSELTDEELEQIALGGVKDSEL